ncbi:MAG TPA: bifunctional YncE family protein/alkaline phosphatase family protein [Bryobacteraceae bacterium]|nr:bifunctional YncE family protein/alkaline phosphatase family protein [Bryobacteraceae bacterium]
MKRKVLITAACAVATLAVATETELFSIIKSNVPLGRQAEGYYVLPTNQLVRPWGEQTLLPGRPVDLAFDAERRLLAILNSNGISVRHGATGIEIGHVRARGTPYTGIAFRPDGGEIWAGETTRTGTDNIIIIPVTSGRPGAAERIALEGHPVPSGIAFAKDGKTAYVALSRNNTVALVDVEGRKVLREIPVGIAPFSVAISFKHNRLFVTNRGGHRPDASDTVAPSSGSNVVVAPLTGATTSGTLSVVDLENYSVREVPVGLAPAAVALNPDETLLGVANAHSDSIHLLAPDTLAGTEVAIPSWPEGTFGSQPTSLAFSGDGKALYVGCGGTNAIVVLGRAADRWTVKGAIPTGWFPSAIAVDGDGGLRVVNIKGVGNTSNGKGAFNSRQFEGSLLKLGPAALSGLAAGMREVKAANDPKFEPVGGVPNLSSLGIRHVFFIIKENRTYDHVFGDMPQGNGEPKLAIYGKEFTPNHHALAEKYVLLDNFYASGAISFEGHQWLMQAFVSDYVERALLSAPRGYAWNMSDALTVSPAGFFWQGAARPIDVRLYGALSLPLRWDPATQNAIDIDEEELLSWSEYWRLYKENKWRPAVGSRSGVPALAHLAARHYPVSSMHIPDQIRAEAFLEELAEREKSGEMPNLLLMTMTSDHTMGTNPASPTPRAMVADNDLALGRMVEGITRSRFWPHSLILVVEDDAQDGLDHVDGHRTVALAIGPHIRRGVVDSNNYNQTSMVRTIQEVFRIPPRTRFLSTARSMNSMFTPEKDLTAYKAIVPAIPLDTMNPPLKALGGRRLQAARQSQAMNWHDVDDVPTHLLNQILWWDAKGYDQEYPKLVQAGVHPRRRTIPERDRR